MKKIMAMVAAFALVGTLSACAVSDEPAPPPINQSDVLPDAELKVESDPGGSKLSFAGISVRLPAGTEVGKQYASEVFWSVSFSGPVHGSMSVYPLSSSTSAEALSRATAEAVGGEAKEVEVSGADRAYSVSFVDEKSGDEYLTVFADFNGAASSKFVFAANPGETALRNLMQSISAP